MRQSTKDAWAVIGGVAAIAALLLYVAGIVLPSWWRAHNACANGNGVVVEQKDILRPTVCLKVNPGAQR